MDQETQKVLEKMTPKQPIDVLAQKVNDLVVKTNSNQTLGQSFFIFVKDMEKKLDAAMDLIINKGLINREEYDIAVDSARGVRKKRDDEVIEKSDVAWVSYEASIDNNEKKLREDSFPIRVGSGRIAFEGALFGKHPHSELTHSISFPPGSNSEYRGKTVHFKIKIHDVKAKEKKDGRKNDGLH